jgi:hypothetical protein
MRHISINDSVWNKEIEALFREKAGLFFKKCVGSSNYNPDSLTNSSRTFADSNYKVIKEEDLILPTSDEDESGVAILNDEVMEDLQ